MRTALLIGLLLLGWAALRTEGFAHTSPAPVATQPVPAAQAAP